MADFSLNVTNDLSAGILASWEPAGSRPRTISIASSSWTWWRPRRPSGSKSSFISTCRCSTWSIACFAPCFPRHNKHNCGRPCDVHSVKLRDRIGVEHPLLADVGCRNTLFNAVPQSAAEAVSRVGRPRRPAFSHRTAGRKHDGGNRGDHRALSATAGRPDQRPRSLDPAQGGQSRRRHPRHARRAPNPLAIL